MNIKNRRPVFVPPQFCAEIDRLSKAALMDMVWDYATQISGAQIGWHGAGDGPVMTEFRARREIILRYRANANAENAA